MKSAGYDIGTHFASISLRTRTGGHGDDKAQEERAGQDSDGKQPVLRPNPYREAGSDKASPFRKAALVLTAWPLRQADFSQVIRVFQRASLVRSGFGGPC